MIRGEAPNNPIASFVRAKPLRTRVDGILLLDKPEGPSSNQALQAAKRLLSALKAGHTGTLDPFASGLLPLAFGEATKFAGFLSDADKAYEATLVLGIVTATGDLTGEVLARNPIETTNVLVDAVFRSFLGEQLQIPPMYSAIKRNGVPLYALARRGESVEREPRPIRISELSVERFDGAELDFKVRCSKGTYIRVLGEDIGRALGCGAAVKRLRRTEVAPFTVREAVSLHQLECLDSEQRAAVLRPIDAALGHIPPLMCDSNEVSRILLGQSVSVSADGVECDSVVRIYHADNRNFIGLGRVVEGQLRPTRLIAPLPAKMS